MRGVKRFALVAGVAAVLLACASPSQPSSLSSNPGPEPVMKKRITAATNANLLRAIRLFTTNSADPPGAGEFATLVNAGLAIRGLQDPLEPQLAETVPTTENGLWKVFPDGRMETTWKLRPNARWQDGTPFTSADVVFTAAVVQDKDLDFIRDARFTAIEGIDAPDPYTVTIRWKQPFIEANEVFASYFQPGALPLPRHLLETAYTTNKATFADLPFWTSEFVGTGAYRIQEWAAGSYVILAANDSYVLGRPRIDEIEVKFIPAAPTLVANILAGAAELTLGRGLSAEQASDIRSQWRDGTVQLTPSGNPRNVHSQHLDPNPAIIGNVQFRRALYQAIDRTEMAQALTAGLGSVADSGLPADNPAYFRADDAVVKYPYDPARTAQMLGDLGYGRAADGMYRDSAGQPLSVEIRATEQQVNVILAVADYWRRVGVATETVAIPDARANDAEYRVTRPGFEVGGNFGNFQNMKDIRRSELPTSENGYRGRNNERYVNAELEGLIDRFYVTLPLAERIDVLRGIFHHLTDQVVVMSLYYDASATIVGHRISNVVAGYFGNAHEWEAK